jgi:hypothetical protein
LDAIVSVQSLRPGKTYMYAPPPPKSRKNTTVVEPEPFDPDVGVFSDVHLPGASKPTVKYREWLAETHSDMKPAEKRAVAALAGLQFMKDTVYEATIQATVGKFVVYLWRKHGFGDNLPDKVKYTLVPNKAVKTMTTMWDFPVFKGGARANFVRTYNKTDPELRLLPGSTEDKLHVDIRRILELAKPPPKKSAKASAKASAGGADAGDAGDAEAEDDEDGGTGGPPHGDDGMELDDPMPLSRATPKVVLNLLDALAARFPDMVRILGRTPHNGSDMYHPPRAMKEEFAALSAIPARAGFVATMGPSDRWGKSPLLDPQKAARPAARMRAGGVETIDERRCIEDAILMHRPRTNGFFLAHADLENIMKTHGLTLAASTLDADFPALFQDKRVLASMQRHLGAVFFAGQELSALVSRGWPLVPRGDSRAPAAVLQEVISDGCEEDAIIWLLIHAFRVGPAVVHGDGAWIRRPLIAVDGADQLAWVMLTTPGNGTGRTWILPEETIKGSVSPYGVKGLAMAAAGETWENKSKEERQRQARQIMERHLPSWGHA